MSETALRGHEQCCEQSPVYAHVVVDVPVSSSQGHFDYVVPPELAAEVAVGSPVIVPFGPRRVQGFVVGISDRSEAGSFHDLKPIQAVAPGAVKVPPDLVELARWMPAATQLMVDAIRQWPPWQASQPGGLGWRCTRSRTAPTRRSSCGRARA